MIRISFGKNKTRQQFMGLVPRRISFLFFVIRRSGVPYCPEIEETLQSG